MVLAQEEARTLNHDYIGTEHILLALIRESGGIAAQVLDARVDRRGGRQQVGGVYRAGPAGPPRGHIRVRWPGEAQAAV